MFLLLYKCFGVDVLVLQWKMRILSNSFVNNKLLIFNRKPFNTVQLTFSLDAFAIGLDLGLHTGTEALRASS